MNNELQAFAREHNIQVLEDGTFNLDGYHSGPGKFEGEPLATEYFYMQSLDGGDNVLEVMPDEQRAFGLKWNDNYVYISEDGNGFVHAAYFTNEDDANEVEMMDLGIDDETLDSHEADDE